MQVSFSFISNTSCDCQSIVAGPCFFICDSAHMRLKLKRSQRSLCLTYVHQVSETCMTIIHTISSFPSIAQNHFRGTIP